MTKLNDVALDRKIEFYEIKRFAEQWQYVVQTMQEQMPSKFKWDKSIDYYHGFLAGFMASINYKERVEPKMPDDQYVQLLKICAIIIAKNLKEKIEESGE